MSEFPSLPLFTDAYLADTRHLSAQEHGSYLLLLMMAWRLPNCRLPNDDAMLAKWASVDARTWRRIKPTVMAFWTLAEDQWCQSRLLKEREFVSKRAEVARQNGKQGGRPKELNSNGSDNPAGSSRVSQPKAPSPSPKPTVIEPRAQQTTNAARPFFYDRLIEAASSRGGCHPNLITGFSQMADLVKAGYSEDELVALVAEKAGPEINSWNYFSKVAQRRAAERAAIVPKPQAPADDWAGRLKVWREDGTWSPAWGPKPNEPGCKAPAELRAAA